MGLSPGALKGHDCLFDQIGAVLLGKEFRKFNIFRDSAIK
jgi:hypothetical protein